MNSMKISSLFDTCRIGPLKLSNRIVMAPMTRCRAGENRVPTPVMATYYEQRATAGLLITEATVVSVQGIGYPNTPGIYSDEQVQGWKQITKAVHAAGGHIVLQLWHCGRISHPLFQAHEALPVAPSAMAPQGQLYTPQGMKPYVTPRALDITEIADIVADFRRGAERAKAAGFDGVEIHGANGYLIDQFLRDGSNQRTDVYGGSAENRSRFLVEVTEAVIGVWGADRVGVRLSPCGTFNDMKDSDPKATFSVAIEKLDALEIAYLHLVEAMEADLRHGGMEVPTAYFRTLFQGALIVCGEYDAAKAEKVIAEGQADAVAFARPFISNPDLPRRLKDQLPLAPSDPATYYTFDPKGYTDYPPAAKKVE